MRMSWWNSRCSSPLGPRTVTEVPSICTWTEGGTGTGCLPMRDMPVVHLPDIAEHFATHLLAPGLLPGHDALRRREDGDAQPAVHAGDLPLLDVDAQAGLAHALEPVQQRLPALGVVEVDTNEPTWPFLEGLEVANEAFVLEHLRDGALHFGGGDVDVVVSGRDGVTDTGQHVGDRVSHSHDRSPPTSWISSRPAACPPGQAAGSRYDRA